MYLQSKLSEFGRMRTLAKEPGRENVEAVSADLVAMPEATQPADVLWLHLFYHDLHTTLIQARGATAAHFNRAVYERRIVPPQTAGERLGENRSRRSLESSPIIWSQLFF